MLLLLLSLLMPRRSYLSLTTWRLVASYSNEAFLLMSESPHIPTRSWRTWSKVTPFSPVGWAPFWQMASDHEGVYSVECLLEIQHWTGDSVLQLDHVSKVFDLGHGY